MKADEHIDHLVELLRSGDEDAVPALISLLEQELTQIARTVAPYRSDADLEKVSELTIERAAERIEQFDPSKSSFATWVGGFVRNELRRFTSDEDRVQDLMGGRPRSEVDRNESDTDLDTEAPETIEPDRDQRTRVLRLLLERLSEADRQILSLRTEGLSYPAIATRLHISAASARQRHHRALERVRRLAGTDTGLIERFEEESPEQA
jgi:RNA polymerase sigma factor (sigma-70 family)